MTNYKMLKDAHGAPLFGLFRGDPVLVHLNSKGKVVMTEAGGDHDYLTKDILNDHVIMIKPDYGLDLFDHDLHQCQVGDLVASAGGWTDIKEISKSRQYSIRIGSAWWCNMEGKFPDDKAPSVFVKPPKYLLDYIGLKPTITAEDLARKVLSLIASSPEAACGEPIRRSEEVKRKLKEALAVLADKSD